ncbi:deoxyribonuclease-1-like, partial [Centruroides sculpturatus]|uniref:deoxyribonuclease-1-like n=1 Tax=Centruroides sculpturatus TaxID=218467 RepID=UPI000C6D1515
MKYFIFLSIAFTLYQVTLCTNEGLRTVDRPLRIGSFNIQNLGPSKMSNEEIMIIVKNILIRYDVILVQEIVTRDESLVYGLLHSINSVAPEGVMYDMALSERLGRKTAKEQYAFFYRKQKVSVLGASVYSDKDDNFMRPPYIVHFLSPTTKNLPSFIAIGIHTQPSNAANETDFLADVYDYAKNKYKTENAIIMGDMNAGCGNVRTSDWRNIRLWTRSDFTWLIGHHVDTTTNVNSCPYDRIVIAGEEMNQAAIRHSANIFNFQNEYELTIEQTRNVSDHWPIEVQLRGRISDDAEINLKPSMCFMITDNRKISDPMIIHRARKKFDFRTNASKDQNGN